MLHIILFKLYHKLLQLKQKNTQHTSVLKIAYNNFETVSRRKIFSTKKVLQKRKIIASEAFWVKNKTSDETNDNNIRNNITNVAF